MKVVVIALFGILVCAGGVQADAAFSGTWDATWYSIYQTSGWMKVRLTQDGRNLTGSLDVQTARDGTFRDVDLTGSVTGDTVTFTTSLIDGTRFWITAKIYFSPDGSVGEGTYSVVNADGSYADSGTLTATKQLPDLKVTAMSPSSREVYPGEELTMSVTIKNDSDYACTDGAEGSDGEIGVTLWYGQEDDYMSNPYDYQESTGKGGTCVFGWVAVTPLAAHASTSGTLWFEAPPEPGTYYFRTFINVKTAAGYARESDFSNNWGPLITITVKPPLKPDLTISFVSPTSKTVYPGDPFSVYVMAENISGSAEAGSFNIACDLSQTDQFDLSGSNPDQKKLDTFFVDVLGPDALVSHTFSLTAPEVPGTYYIRPVADGGKVVDEASEANNWGDAVVLTVAEPPNNAPSNPMPVSPSNASRSRSLTLTLQGSEFSDPDGDRHANTQWQVDNANWFSTPEWDSGEDSAGATQVSVPAGYLLYSTLYYWRVRYKDSRGAWSDWSYSRTFRTESLVHVIAPEAGGNITPSGNVPAGYSLTLRAIPEPGWKFKHWLIDGTVASEGEKELTITRLEVDTTVEAVFEKIKAMPWLNLLLE